MIQFDWYFSKGLVQPPTSYRMYRFSGTLETQLPTRWKLYKEVIVFLDLCLGGPRNSRRVNRLVFFVGAPWFFVRKLRAGTRKYLETEKHLTTSFGFRVCIYIYIQGVISKIETTYPVCIREYDGLLPRIPLNQPLYLIILSKLEPPQPRSPQMVVWFYRVHCWHQREQLVINPEDQIVSKYPTVKMQLLFSPPGVCFCWSPFPGLTTDDMLLIGPGHPPWDWYISLPTPRIAQCW